jgi:phosphohistidine phosphatase
VKTLVLIRHAKSDWSSPTELDLERPLNPRGMRDAPRIAQRFVKDFPHSFSFISSPAIRAYSTAVIFAEAAGIDVSNIAVEPGIYEADLHGLLAVIGQLEKREDGVILFGHNPGLSILIDYLTGTRIDMPTCAVAVLAFDVNDWAYIGPESGRLISFDYPKKTLET